MTSGNSLEVSDLTVAYGGDAVIDGLSWRLGGEGSLVTAILGPSGCGKSTLIRAIAGLESPVRGTVRFGGVDLAGVEVHRRDFGVVFQDGQLFGGRSVASNIGYGLRMRRWSRRAIAERVGEMLDVVGLAGYDTRLVDTLSGGQAQRVALARALAPRPRLLLLDEPLAALDRRMRDELAVEISEIVRAAGVPTMVVTHDHTEAATMADEIAVMRDGVMIQTDAPAALWRRPVDEWTVRFLGATTVIDAQVRSGVADTVLGGMPLDLPDGSRRLGLRPESVSVGPLSSREAEDAAATVVLVAELPGGPRVRIDTPIGEIDAVTNTSVAIGDRVRMRLVPERVAVIGP
ncbi:ABC-type spermidine/putrescine transport system, ATPase component [Gordonia terrae C-6]|uniref:ABC-type spermidine/putrescine transport system, ATPase component n=1 Tax=Gordonia terrae C-6 TaxID=1316928 RepID=R7YE80_9ACTN|nr:ABC transporter ATP-binding protein [Gordonia terrae]EON34262.1 ABC-type spermidine/putrescine transport system, ATPase component [Gordonia terrae C-6]